MAEMKDPSGRDWPYDPDSDEGSEGGRKYGLAVVAKKVDEHEDFPLDVAAFVDEYGEEPVRVNYRRVVSVADVFDYVDAAEIEDKVSFNRAVGAAMREGGLWDFLPGTA